MALMACQKNPALLRDPRSVVASILEASQLGLEIDGILGHAYLVPYKGKCQMQIGYRGMLSLAYRSPAVASIDVRAVYIGDVFEVTGGTQPHILHKLTATDRSVKNLTHVYAVAVFKGGGCIFEVMDRQQIEQIRGRSPSGSSGPWQTDYEQMATKSCIKRLVKRLPMASEHLRAVVADEYRDQGIEADPPADVVVEGSEDGANGSPLDAVVEANAEKV